MLTGGPYREGELMDSMLSSECQRDRRSVAQLRVGLGHE